jgi:hypothetical protein
MGSQLDLFGAPVLPPGHGHQGGRVSTGSLPGRPTADRLSEVSPDVRLAGEPTVARCPHHGPEYVCEREGLGTDYSGFVHRSECKGRIPLRRCKRCNSWTTPGQWNHADWFHCLRCVPLGQLSELGRLSSPSKNSHDQLDCSHSVATVRVTEADTRRGRLEMTSTPARAGSTP